MCSTPFGINEWITVVFLNGTAANPVCSTPFGINEWITRNIRRRKGKEQVLNAFRHQRMDHGPVAVSWRGSNHVLNAFRHQRMDHFPLAIPGLSRTLVLNAFRHQRMDHSGGGGKIEVRRIVLNAFRHQQMDHVDITTSAAASRSSAQRLSASTNGSRFKPVENQTAAACSTPFGINEWIT